MKFALTPHYTNILKKLSTSLLVQVAILWLSQSVLLTVLTSSNQKQCHVDPATGRLVPPPLASKYWMQLWKKLPGFPIVLHGSSSVPQEEVDTINKFGGKLDAAIGIPEEELRKAAKSAVCKINIDSDSRLAMTAAIRQVFAEKPAEFDPRKYLGPARDNMEKMYKHKILNVLGSDGKLAQC